jgi:zinc D-Ala-D-Ala carboxypeptidase
MHLSRFFTLAELTRSDTAAREGIPNQPGEAQIGSLRTLCTTVLDPLREAVARPMRVSSGFRGPALNARIGGSATSQHSQGQAADVQVPGLDMLELFKTVIRLKLPFDQLIYEAQSATVKWVHLSHRSGANRGEIRVAQFNAAGRPTGYPLVTAEQALAMVERTTRSARSSLDPGYIEVADEPEFDSPPESTTPTRVRAPARRRSGPNAPAVDVPAVVAAKKAPVKVATNGSAARKGVPRQSATRSGAIDMALPKAPPLKRTATKAALAGPPPQEPAAAKKTATKSAAAKKAPARTPKAPARSKPVQPAAQEAARTPAKRTQAKQTQASRAAASQLAKAR